MIPVPGEPRGFFQNLAASDVRSSSGAWIVLDANRNNPNNGTNIQLWSFLGGTNQYWYYGAI